MQTASRRPLSFDSLDKVSTDLDRLLAGNRTVGKWTFGQICNHLTKTFTGSVEGFPDKAPWLIRVTIAPLVFRHILKSQQMAEGIKAPSYLNPPSGLDDRAEAEALRAALRLFTLNSGPVQAHPFFGPIGRDGWEELHRLHCAHHLSFALPTSS
jgi:hypothetical protein